MLPSMVKQQAETRPTSQVNTATIQMQISNGGQTHHSVHEVTCNVSFLRQLGIASAVELAVSLNSIGWISDMPSTKFLATNGTPWAADHPLKA
eukprot:scaffold74051_cov33-Tisochrysis_lutea.AAC.1